MQTQGIIDIIITVTQSMRYNLIRTAHGVLYMQISYFRVYGFKNIQDKS